jgi:hypothetical protein
VIEVVLYKEIFKKRQVQQNNLKYFNNFLKHTHLIPLLMHVVHNNINKDYIFPWRAKLTKTRVWIERKVVLLWHKYWSALLNEPEGRLVGGSTNHCLCILEGAHTLFHCDKKLLCYKGLWKAQHRVHRGEELNWQILLGSVTYCSWEKESSISTLSFFSS